MGTQDIIRDLDPADLRSFITRLLHDLQALEAMIDQGAIESGVRRIGAEQEIFLVDRSWRPAPVAVEILEAVDDSHFTTELGRFNLEINLDPLQLPAFSANNARLHVHGKGLQSRAGARAPGGAKGQTGC
jgi:hypothetical protein